MAYFGLDGTPFPFFFPFAKRCSHLFPVYQSADLSCDAGGFVGGGGDDKKYIYITIFFPRFIIISENGGNII